MQEYWVDGVLRQSLYHEVLILLGKRQMDEMVEQPPWKYVGDLPDCCRELLQQDHNIHTVFDETGLLLIIRRTRIWEDDESAGTCGCPDQQNEERSKRTSAHRIESVELAKESVA